MRGSLAVHFGLFAVAELVAIALQNTREFEHYQAHFQGKSTSPEAPRNTLCQ
jgi:hypothetical protein